MVMVRTDLKRLERFVEDFNEYVDGTGTGVWIDSIEEDFGIDLALSGYTKSGEHYSRMENKSITYRDLFSDSAFVRTGALRNDSVRYGLTGYTIPPSQEEIEADTTPRPDWANSDKPLHFLNAANRWGDRRNAKITKLLEGKYWVSFTFIGGHLIFSPSALRNAIVGYAWVKLTPDTEFTDKPPVWELKAVIDLSAFTEFIETEIPYELLRNPKNNN